MNFSKNIILSIGESHSGGSRGQEADIKTFVAHQVLSTNVITSIVGQSRLGRTSVFSYPPEFVAQQITCALQLDPPTVVKVGPLADLLTVRTVTQALTPALGNGVPLVLELCGYSSATGDIYVATEADLLSFATVVLSGAAQGRSLLGRDIRSIDDMKLAATKLAPSATTSVLFQSRAEQQFTTLEVIKSLATSSDTRVHWSEGCGPILAAILRRSCEMDLTLPVKVDVLYSQSEPTPFLLIVQPFIPLLAGLELGCTASAAIACRIALGQNIEDSVVNATEYAYYSALTATRKASSIALLHHNYLAMRRVVPRPTRSDPYPLTRALIESSQELWDRYVGHPFVMQVGTGTLSQEKFIFYLKQDYLFCKHDARANGLLAFKARTFPSMQSAAQMVIQVASDTQPHKDFFAEHNIPLADVERTQEEPELVAFTRYVFDIGLLKDDFMLGVALTPCVVGYGEIGMGLTRKGAFEDQILGYQDKSTRIRLDGNPYRNWIEGLASNELVSIVRGCLEYIERRGEVDPVSHSRLEELSTIWGRVVQFEIEFWDMAMRGDMSKTLKHLGKAEMPRAKL
ncbi:heme oxygenase-like protein [Ceratobasidium sp. AG-I]|nr:heme oxygenase-like protein [Ceratobasidium sp. AG-I]